MNWNTRKPIQSISGEGIRGYIIPAKLAMNASPIIIHAIISNATTNPPYLSLIVRIMTYRRGKEN
jgi:hypothetical protein